ncbi:MAG: DNA polymerase III subunit gamma/tau [Chloroflexia bacterium]|nr:DNA polymerase III subunit gamma/tau [Chloroflexia bacterium]
MTEASLFDLPGPEDAQTTGSPSIDASAGGSFPHAGSRSASLYRKYRPRSFDADDLFGQEHIVNTLRNAIALDRIAHAYLFCGPRGTGKTTTARLLAKAVNCLDPDPRTRPCNQCTACDAINRNATTDVIEIDAASNRGIDDIRDLRERVTYAPTQMKTKFYIIDEAHQITGAAANAFLKTLEEPPPHTKFVLATTDPEELLDTIVSRCQRFDFRRINLEAMVACLRKVSTIERIAIDDDAMQIIARHATGSLRDALGLLDQVAVYRESDTASDDERVTANTVRTVLGVSRNERVESLVAALADRDASKGLIAINQAVDAGDDIRQLGRQLVAYLRMLLLERAGGPADADEIAKNLAARFSLVELARLAQLFSGIDHQVKHAAFPQLPLEIAIVEGANRDGLQSRAPLAAREIPSNAREASDSPSHAAAPSPQLPEPAADAPPRQSLRDRVQGRDKPSSRSPIIGGGQARVEVEPVSAPNDQVRPPAPVATTPLASTVTPARSSSLPVRTLSLELIVDLWSKIRADVKSVNRRIEALIQQVDPVTINGDVIVLVSPYEFHRNRVNSDEARHVIEDVISRLVGSRVQISCVTREEAAAFAVPSLPTVARPDPEPSDSPEAPMVVMGEPEPQSRSTMTGIAVGGEAPVERSTTAVASDVAETPSPESSIEDDERRIQAVKNIFDAEEMDD